MSSQPERLSLPRPDRFQLGAPVDYRLGHETASELAKRALNGNHIVRVTHFPPTQQVLTDFSKAIGPLMPKYRATGDASEDYVGDVKFRPDISSKDRLATERDGELRPHTAKSWGLERPRYFGLLMVNPGWTDQQKGMNGESMFVRAQDAVVEMARRFPDTIEEDFRLLTTTPVSFTATHLPDDPAHMPILFPVDDNTLGMRYKENMKDVLTRLGLTLPNGDRYVEAVERFDEALQTAPHIDIPLQAGELVIMDNRVVAHARKPFVSERLDDTEEVYYNPRHLYNIHMMPEEYK